MNVKKRTSDTDILKWNDKEYYFFQGGEGDGNILDYAWLDDGRNDETEDCRQNDQTSVKEFSDQHRQYNRPRFIDYVKEQTHEVESTEEHPTVPQEQVYTIASYPTRKGRYWHKCLALNDKKYAYRALHNHELPDHDELNELVQLFGRKSKLISAICDNICLRIRENYKCIVDVWAAFEVDSHNIIFVLIVNERIRFSQKFQYSYIQRSLYEMSDEAREVIYTSSCLEMSSDVKEHLRKSINLINVEIMQNHKYLMMLSASSVRSKGYNKQSHAVMRENCIVLYVLVKGYIPIKEDPFEQQYNGVPVDVREGCFQLFTGTASNYHEHLKIGCQIHKENIGTLGGFIDYHGFGTCGITCAHVLLNPRDMAQLNSKTDDVMDCGLTALEQTVYQPDNTQERHAFGKVLKAIYRQGGGGESGIDIAAIKIGHRYPKFGDFPDLKDGHPANLHFDSGKTADYTGIQSGYVLKFGASTGLTFGSVVMDTSTLSVKTYPLYSYNKEYQIVLHNLLEIQTIEGQRVFADQGDSGALVFCQGENDELYCIGVVEGGTFHDTCVVMPIAPILQQFNIFTFKKFDKNRLLQHFDTKLDQLRNEITQTISQNEQKLGYVFEGIQKQLNQIEKKMQPYQSNQ